MAPRLHRQRFGACRLCLEPWPCTAARSDADVDAWAREQELQQALYESMRRQEVRDRINQLNDELLAGLPGIPPFAVGIMVEVDTLLELLERLQRSER